MGLLSETAQKLKSGQTVQIRPTGSSMSGKIESGNLVTIEPCKASDLSADDIVLAKVKNNYYLHIIKGIRNGMYLIGNNKGKINGWSYANEIYGRVAKIENE